MFGTTLQRMIFWELVRVFSLALCGLTGLFLLGGVVQEAAQRGLTPNQIFTVVPLLIPTTLPYTVPATILFAVCIVYGRMANDNEITALRSAGVHLGRLLAPAVILALGVTAGLSVLQYSLIPRTRQQLAERVLADADELLYGMLKKQGCIRHPQLPFAVFVREVRGKQLIDAVFKRREADGKYSLVAHAREAKLWTDPANDKVWIFMPNCVVTGREQLDGNLKDHTFDVNFPLSTFRDTQVRPMNMTWEQIQAKREELQSSAAGRLMELASVERQIAECDPPPRRLIDLRHHLTYQQAEGKRVLRQLAAEQNMRPALAIGGLCFILVAFPVGVWMHRSDYLSTFVSCFLPVIAVYYPLLLAGTNLAKEGRLPATIAVWVADAVTVAAGAYLIRKLFRQ